MSYSVPPTTCPTIHQERCLNLRQGTLTCRICRDVCPQNALGFDGLTVLLQTTACDGCCLCCADCPTEAFEQVDFSPTRLLEQTQNLQQLTLYCRKIHAAQCPPNAIGIPCLGLLDARLLQALQHTGISEIRLRGLQQCADCPTRSGRQRLMATLLAATVDQKKYFPAIRSDHATVQHSLTSPQPAPPAAQRRAFLQSLAHSSSRLTAYAVLQALPASSRHFGGAPNTDNSPVLSQQDYAIKHLPQRQQLALLVMDALDAVPEEKDRHTLDSLAWFTHIEGSGNCSACAGCALICPSGAITIGRKGQSWLLHFQSAHCIGCTLCLSLCPEQALQAATPGSKLLVDGRVTTTLFTCEEQQCPHCGKTFVNTDQQSALCPVCLNNQTIENDLFGNTEFFRITKPGR